MPNIDLSPGTGIRRTISTPLAILVLVVVTFAAFSPILSADFGQWDDAEQLASNQYLNPPEWNGLAKRWAGPFMNIYIPLTHTVWFVVAMAAQSSDHLNVHGTHLSPLPFKLTSLLFHAGTSSIVFLILSRMCSSRLLALAGACLFCLHPVQVESVGWTSGLKDILLGFFGSACVLFYLGETKSNFRLSTLSYTMAIVAMVCACLSKPTAFVLPAMLVIIDLFIARRGVKEMFQRLLPFVIMSITFAWYARYVQPPIDLKITLTPLERILVPAHSLAFYCGKLFWPSRLGFDYGVNWFYLLGSRQLHIAWLVPAAVAFLVACSRRRFPLLTPGVLLAIIPLAPVSGLVVFDFSYYSITSDHYLYLPMLGVSIAAISVLDRLPARQLAWIVMPVLLVMGTLSFRQSLTWQTPMSETMQTLKVNPESFSAYSILAIIELGRSNGEPAKLEYAEALARKSIALRPGNARSHNMLANVLSARGKNQEALEEIDRSLELAPYDKAYHLARAGILGELHRGEESIKELKEVLRLDADNRLAKELVGRYEAIVREQRRPATRPATVPTTAPEK